MLSRRFLLLATAAAPWAAAAAGDDAAVEVEAGVYVLPSAAGNAGFVVGRGGVVVIDAGTSPLHGQALLAAVAQVTPLPVRLALLTGARPESVAGAGALQERGIPVWMSRDAALRGTAAFRPDALFDETHVVETSGRPLLVQLHGRGDCSVFDVRSGTLFAGGLLDNGLIPDLAQRDLDDWREALDALRTLRLSTVVPGRGAVGGPELVDGNRRYLALLERRCAELLRQGVAAEDIADAAVAMPEFARWDQGDGTHRRNAALMTRRLALSPPPAGASSPVP